MSRLRVRAGKKSISLLLCSKSEWICDLNVLKSQPSQILYLFMSTVNKPQIPPSMSALHFGHNMPARAEPLLRGEYAPIRFLSIFDVKWQIADWNTQEVRNGIESPIIFQNNTPFAAYITLKQTWRKWINYLAEAQKKRKMTKYTKYEQINKTGQAKWAFSEMFEVVWRGKKMCHSRNTIQLCLVELMGSQMFCNAGRYPELFWQFK